MVKTSHRWFINSLVAIAAIGGMLATTGLVANAAPAEQPPSAADVTAALVARSEVIPIQPLRAEPSATTSAAFHPLNEPVWTRTCERGYGMEIWNDLNPQNCLGTMTYYYYNVAKGSFNMVAWLAVAPGRGGTPASLMNGLDAWCSSHSFECMVVGVFASIGANFLFA